MINTSEAALRDAEIARKYAASTVEGLTRRGIIDRYMPIESAARDAIADAIKNALHEALAARATSKPGAALESFVKSLGPNPYHPENDINEVWALVEPKGDRLEALGAFYELASRAYQAGRAAASGKGSEQ